MNTPLLIIMVGLPGSGKSTKAKELAKAYDCEILSSDNIRQELLGSESDQSQNDKVFRLLYQRMNQLLSEGKSVIIDATNTTMKARKRILSECRVDCTKEAYLMVPHIKDCIERDFLRDRSVGEEVIYKFERSFQCPQYFEGFDIIECPEWNFNDFSLRWNSKAAELLVKMDHFEQHNPHHIYTVGEHCSRQSNLIVNYCSQQQERGLAKYLPTLRVAGILHDVGKLFTQHFDENGVAHYYNHDSVGTYYLASHLDLILQIYKGWYRRLPFQQEVLDILFFVNFHMRTHNDFQTPKAQRKYRNLFGDTRFELLTAFGECDRQASGTYDKN